jgi:hypothetical protein
MNTATNKPLSDSIAPDWLSKITRLDDPRSFHDPGIIKLEIPTVERVEKLVDVLTVNENDASCFALLEILSAVEMLFSDHSDDARHDIEKMVWTAKHRAYLYTTHHARSLNQCLVESMGRAAWSETAPEAKPAAEKTARRKGKGRL